MENSKTNYEYIISMSKEKMAEKLVDIIAELFEDGIPCEEYVYHWLSEPFMEEEDAGTT